MKDYIIYLFLGLNVISMLLMGIDKFKAVKHKYRIPESILLLFGLFGGTGIALGSIIFNHKHGKVKFRILIPVELLLNLALLFYIAMKFY